VWGGISVGTQVRGLKEGETVPEGILTNPNRLAPSKKPKGDEGGGKRQNRNAGGPSSVRSACEKRIRHRRRGKGKPIKEGGSGKGEKKNYSGGDY